MPVDRCVCHEISFAALKAEAERQGPNASIESLAKATGAGTGCGTCVPYLKLMLETGRTSFAVLPIVRHDPDSE